MSQRVIISTNLESEIAGALAECEHDKIFVLTDETTVVKCWPVVKNYFSLKDAKVITIGATDTHKDLDNDGTRMEVVGRGRCFAPFVHDKPGWWNGYRLGWLCRSNFQAWHQLHQHPHYAPLDGGCFGGRKDGHQLRWTEERDRRVLRLQVCHSRY